MKQFLRALCLVVVAACGRSHGTECSTRSHFELHRIDEDSGPSKELAAKASFDHHGGLHADIDQWTSEPGTPHHDFYVAAPDRATLVTFAGQPPVDHEWLFGETGGAWRTYYAEKRILIDQSDFASVMRISDPNTDRPALLVTLTPTGQSKFAAITRANIGHKVAMVIDGNVVTAPIIMGAIDGGKLEITFDSKTSSDALVKQLCR